MHTITARNVNGAYHAGLNYLLDHGREEPSRAGPVLVAPGPVTTLYMRPAERVLFSAARDANPFFHLAEALWMLAGRSDAALLNRYVKDFGARFAEADGRVHGAYGYRWRYALGYDQITFIIDKFKREPTTRQCVLQLWDGYYADDLCGEWKDRPCNTHAYFRLQDGALAMLVCCRSNDAIWGAYGANAVHFSVLQEYMAAMLGVRVGAYHQVSFNFHAYLTKLAAPQWDDRYAARGLATAPLVSAPASFDRELVALLAMVDSDNWGDDTPGWENGFLADSALPLLRAHSHWRAGRRERAYEGLEQVIVPDWRIAAHEWMERRLRRA